jgi:hypothetical protein
MLLLQGCGAFGAEVPLKTLIQLLAATLARRTLRYFTFASDSCEFLPEILRILEEKRPTVKQLYQATLAYHPDRLCGRKTPEYIADLLDGSDLKKQAAYRAQKLAEKAAQQASIRPSLQRPNGASSVRHANAARSSAADANAMTDDPMLDDPIEDFPDDDQSGYNSEDERAMREMESQMED